LPQGQQVSPKIQELYLRQILDGDKSVGLSKGLIDLMKEYMVVKNWPEENRKRYNTFYLSSNLEIECPEKLKTREDLLR